MADRRGVEEELGVGDLVRPIGLERALQVADAHVVALDRQVVAAEVALGELQVARRRLQRLARVEALVDTPPLGLQPRDPRRRRRPPDPARDPLRRSDVDLQPQQVGRGLGEDLRQPDGRPQVVGGRDVRPATALQEDDRLQRVRILVGAGRDVLDRRPQPLHALRGRQHAARALGVEHVAEARGGASLEVGAAAGVVGERVAGGIGRPAARRQHTRTRRLAAAAQHHDDDPRHDDDAQPGGRHGVGASSGHRGTFASRARPA